MNKKRKLKIPPHEILITDHPVIWAMADGLSTALLAMVAEGLLVDVSCGLADCIRERYWKKMAMSTYAPTILRDWGTTLTS